MKFIAYKEGLFDTGLVFETSYHFLIPMFLFFFIVILRKSSSWWQMYWRTSLWWSFFEQSSFKFASNVSMSYLILQMTKPRNGFASSVRKRPRQGDVKIIWNGRRNWRKRKKKRKCTAICSSEDRYQTCLILSSRLFFIIDLEQHEFFKVLSTLVSKIITF